MNVGKLSKHKCHDDVILVWRYINVKKEWNGRRRRRRKKETPASNRQPVGFYDTDNTLFNIWEEHKCNVRWNSHFWNVLLVFSYCVHKPRVFQFGFSHYIMHPAMNGEIGIEYQCFVDSNWCYRNVVMQWDDLQIEKNSLLLKLVSTRSRCIHWLRNASSVLTLKLNLNKVDNLTSYEVKTKFYSQNILLWMGGSNIISTLHNAYTSRII